MSKIRTTLTIVATALAVAGAVACGGGTPTPTPTPTTTTPPTTQPSSSPEPTGDTAKTISTEQRNATRTAKSYLEMEGFSRNGLIKQLSAEAGEGYSVKASTAAVDSLHVDWNAQAVRVAKNYLSMQGFSRSGMIQQLESSAGEGFTHSQAVYGATKAGL